MKVRFIVIFILLFWTGCTKDKDPPPPVIEPGSYFPVYPGSWWKYLVNDSVVQLDTTSDDYRVHSFKVDGEPDRYSDAAMVPFYNDQPIYGYYYVESIDYPSTIYEGIYELWPILSEEVGYTFWAYWFDGRLTYPVEKVTVKSKTFNGTDSVLLLVSGWTNVYFDHYILPKKRYRTFVKDVGLTSDILVDTVTSDTLSRKILTDYYVSHPF